MLCLRIRSSPPGPTVQIVVKLIYQVAGKTGPVFPWNIACQFGGDVLDRSYDSAVRGPFLIAPAGESCLTSDFLSARGGEFGGSLGRQPNSCGILRRAFAFARRADHRLALYHRNHASASMQSRRRRQLAGLECDRQRAIHRCQPELADFGKGLRLVVAPQVGLEPTTLRLTAGCSTIELLRNRRAQANQSNITEAPLGWQLAGDEKRYA